jgi:hypothetical protein
MAVRLDTRKVSGGAGAEPVRQVETVVNYLARGPQRAVVTLLGETGYRLEWPAMGAATLGTASYSAMRQNGIPESALRALGITPEPSPTGKPVRGQERAPMARVITRPVQQSAPPPPPADDETRQREVASFLAMLDRLVKPQI